jgi:tetratricopeptide (TPR) repeat protein
MVRAAAAGKGAERDRLAHSVTVLERDDPDPGLRHLASDALAEIARFNAKPFAKRVRIKTVRPWHTAILTALALVLMPVSLLAIFNLFAIAWNYFLPGTVGMLDRLANPPAQDAVVAFAGRRSPWPILLLASILGPSLVIGIAHHLSVRRRGILLGTGEIWTWNDKALSTALADVVARVQHEVTQTRPVAPPRGLQRGSRLRRRLRGLAIYIGASLLACLLLLCGIAAIAVYWQFRYVEVIATSTRQIDSGGLSGLRLSEALLCRGLAWQNAGRSGMARFDYDRALAIDANQANVLLARAYAWYSGRRSPYSPVSNAQAVDNAIEDATKAIAIDPLLYEAYFDRAVYRLARQDRQGAGEDLAALREVMKRIEVEKPIPGLDVSRELRRLERRASGRPPYAIGARVPMGCLLADRPADWFGGSLWDLGSLIGW